MAKVIKKVTAPMKDLEEGFKQILNLDNADYAKVSELYPYIMSNAVEFIDVVNILFGKLLVNIKTIDVVVKKFHDIFRRISADFAIGGAFHQVKRNSGIVDLATLSGITAEQTNIQKKLAGATGAYDRDSLLATWSKIKNSEFLKFVAITVSNIKTLIDAEAKRTGGKYDPFKEPNLDFIRNAVGMDARVFEYNDVCINMYVVMDYLQRIDENLKQDLQCKFLHLTLRVIYQKGIEIYKTQIKPDIDVTNFSAVLVKSIATLRQKIPNCDRAFNLVENSVNMLEANFPDYYADVVRTKNTGVILERFMEDIIVRADKSKDPILNAQTKRMIAAINAEVRKAQRESGVTLPPELSKIGDFAAGFTSDPAAQSEPQETPSEVNGSEKNNRADQSSSSSSSSCSTSSPQQNP